MWCDNTVVYLSIKRRGRPISYDTSSMVMRLFINVVGEGVLI